MPFADLTLHTQFPGYLANPPKPLDPADRTRFEKQYADVKEIIEIFEKPDYSDTNTEYSAKILSLMSDVSSSLLSYCVIVRISSIDAIPRYTSN